MVVDRSSGGGGEFGPEQFGEVRWGGPGVALGALLVAWLGVGLVVASTDGGKG